MAQPGLRLMAVIVGWALTLSVGTYGLFAPRVMGYRQPQLSATYSAGAATTILVQLAIFPRLVGRLGKLVRFRVRFRVSTIFPRLVGRLGKLRDSPNPNPSTSPPLFPHPHSHSSRRASGGHGGPGRHRPRPERMLDHHLAAAGARAATSSTRAASGALCTRAARTTGVAADGAICAAAPTTPGAAAPPEAAR